MQNFYPLYVSAALKNSSQQVGVNQLLLYDDANGAYGSLELQDGVIGFRDSADNAIFTQSSVNVRDIDGSPSISAITIEFTNGTVTDQGSGIARVTISISTLTATLKHTEVTLTPTGTTQTVDLNAGNHQTLTLASTTGNPTVTLTVPSGASSAGTLIVKQHGTTPRDITWAVSSGTLKWCGTEPTWASDAVSSERVVAWRWDGSVMYLAPTEVAA